MKLTLLPHRTSHFAAVILLTTAMAASGQVIRPAPPKEYDAIVRFQIRAPLPGWYDRYDEMIAALKKQGFQAAEQPEGELVDPSNDRLSGVVAAGDVAKLQRVPAVRTILLRPRGVDLGMGRVTVRLKLPSGLGLVAQRILSRQVVSKLAPIGFQEAMGYHHEGFTLLVGAMEVALLDELLSDLRTLPRGWLVPEEPISTLPMPIRNQVPVQIVEVLPNPADLPPAAVPPAAPAIPPDAPHLVKVAPALRTLIGPDKDGSKLIRVEAVLARTPPDDDFAWERMLRAAGTSVVVEGRLGNIAAVLVSPVQAGELARSDTVLHVRLPQSAEPVRRPAAGNPVNALANTRLGLLHQRGFRGAGIKVVVVGGDFGGWENLRGKGLPKNARLIDFTAPRNPTLLPDPMPSSDGAIGSGVIAALAVAQAAPDAELVLVRLDPAAPHQLMLLAQILNEPAVFPRVFEARYNEIVRDRASIDTDRLRFVEERKRAYAERVFDEGDPAVPDARKKFQESEERIRRAEANLKDLEKRQLELDQRTQRFLSRRADLEVVQGARVVVSTLTWDSGYPTDGANALARYLDEHPFVGYRGDPSYSRIKSLARNRGTVWVQAAGDGRGQVWSGLFRDADGNGAMEFAPSGIPLPAGRWTPELNFLGWEEYGKGYSREFARPTRVRVALQWREPHDRQLFGSPDDPYRTPNANFVITVLRQRDPSGTKVASDDLEPIAKSDALPVRLALDPSMGSYEVAAEFDAVPGARYAIRVNGRIPNSVQPYSEAVESSNYPLEISPRISLHSEDRSGRPVYLDYGVPGPLRPGEQLMGVGMPADARSALTVGAADADGRPQYYSSVGAGANRQLLVLPEVLAFDAIELPGGLKAGGSWVATAFEGGMVACLMQMDAPAQTRLLLPMLHAEPGTVLRIPANWLK